jgi:putative ABC transport system permease protein
MELWLRELRLVARSLYASRLVVGTVVIVVAAGAGAVGAALQLWSRMRNRPAFYSDQLPAGRAPTDGFVEWTPALQPLAQLQDNALAGLLGLMLALTLLAAGVALCNTALLLLSRAVERYREVAVHAALGASPARMARLLLAEGAGLGLLSIGLALLLAHTGALQLQRSWPSLPLPWDGTAAPALLPLGVAAGFLTVVLLCALLPVTAALRRNLRALLVAGSRATAGPVENALRGLIASLQVAAALVLLTCSGLLLQGFSRGSETELSLGAYLGDTLAIRLALPPAHELPEQSPALHEIAARIGTLPGIADSSYASAGTWVGVGSRDNVHALTGIPTLPSVRLPAQYHSVGPSYFRSLGVPVLLGRELEPSDRDGAERVVVVNEIFTYQFKIEADPIGKQVQLGRGGPRAPFYTIVGVVRDSRAPGIGSQGEPTPKIYLSALQHPPRFVDLAVRTTGDPEQVISDVTGLLAGVPGVTLLRAAPLADEIAGFQAPLRWFGGVYGALAAIAAGLALLGLHATMRSFVVRRQREIGIRLALGATPRAIRRWVLGRTIRIALWGLGLGALGAIPLARLLQMWLYGIDPFQPLLFGAIGLTLGLVTVLASLQPAARAARVDPASTMRAE